VLITEIVLAAVALGLGVMAIIWLAWGEQAVAAWLGAVGFVLCQVIWILRLSTGK
jgi:hypothetical protein